jgi:hypothetical protein
MDLPRGFFQSGPANREDRKEGEESLQLLDPEVYSGDAEVDLLRRSGRPLVDQPEYVTEPPPRLVLGHDPESDLVAYHQERHAEIPGPGQEPVEFVERLLLAGRNPQGEGVEQDRIPHIRRFQYFAQVTDLQRTPPRGSALPVESYAPLQILVSIHDGGSHVEDTLASQ